nr:hypothetical protein [Tanacetum cinerariifolium]
EDYSDSDDDSWGDSENESDDVNDEDGDNDDNRDDDNNYKEEEQDEEYVYTQVKDKPDDEEKMFEEEDDDVAKELYGDLNIPQGLRDTDMTDAEQGGEDQQNASHKSGFVQEEEDAHVTLTTVHDKTEGTLKFISKIEDCHIYGAVIPDGMINDDIKLSKAYKTYLDYATGKVPPKNIMKFKKHASPKLKTVHASPKEPTQKAPAKIGRGKCIELLSDAALLEEAQLRETLRKIKKETHKL